MKYLKILGLAAVAAMALTAFFGATSASANVLCTENKNPCPGNHPTEKKLIVGDIIKATAVNPVLTASPEVTCTHSEVEGHITNAGGKGINVTGTIDKLTFSTCHAFFFGSTVSCSVDTTKHLPAHFEVTGTDALKNATLRVKKEATGANVDPGATVVCGGFLTCTFSKAEFALGITGGNPATVNAAAVPLSIGSGGFGCPSEAKWDADYKAIAPNISLFVMEQ